MTSPVPPYRCIVCLAETPTLYKTAADQYIKLSECARCGEVVDRYVECETSVVIIDMMLLDISAYRHILHNSSFATSVEGLVKAMACLALYGGYYSWASLSSSTSAPPAARHGAYSQETVFYCTCLLAAARQYLVSEALDKTIDASFVCQLSVVLHIPATVWQLTQWPLYRVLAALYSALTATLALSGMVGCSNMEAGAVVAVSAITSNALYATVLALLPS
ncbi:Arv1 protein [Trinorchestia longiramus]|nr:Arv1 protein [Trinorchestia longiramus]